MATSTELTVTQTQARHVSTGDDNLFPDLPPLDPFDIKKEEIAAQLVGLLHHSACSRSHLAEALGWKKSRVTSVLSGRCNLTLQTVWDVVKTLGVDFDLVFREPTASRATQPWESQRVSTRLPYFLSVQSPQEVAADFRGGNAKLIYLSIGSKPMPTHNFPAVGLSEGNAFLPTFALNFEPSKEHAQSGKNTD